MVGADAGRVAGGGETPVTTGTLIVETAGDRTRLAVTGEFDTPVRERLLAEVIRLVSERSAIELDLRRLASIDSSGLGTVIQADRLVTAAGAPRLRLLVAETGMVRRLVELTMLHLTLEVVPG